MVNIGLAFPGRRVGGGTRGECSARKIMHLVPESNIAFQNKLGHFALIIGPSNDPKDININFKEFEEMFSSLVPICKAVNRTLI